MPKLFIDGACELQSVGTHAMTICSMTLLREFIPDAEFTILSTHPEVDYRRYKKYDFNLRIVRYGESDLTRVFTLLKEYSRADMIVGIYADAFVKETLLNGPLEYARFFFKFLLASFARKPVIVFPSSMGPFDGKLTRFLARVALNTTELIMVREEITGAHLREVGVSRSRIHVFPDIAFILRPASNERIREIFLTESINENDGTLIGMNVSQLINYKSRNVKANADYIELMAKVADYLVDNLNAIVILIPHEIYPKEIKEITGEAKRIGGDDFTATKEVFMKAKNKHRIMRISNEYDAAELKGIISRCHLFIGARMHSVIAAISMGIPAIAIEYSHKAPGIMVIVGLDKYVCDFRTMSFDELTRKINSIWLHREEIKKDLVPRVETLKESVWFIGKIVKGLMDAVS